MSQAAFDDEPIGGLTVDAKDAATRAASRAGSGRPKRPPRSPASRGRGPSPLRLARPLDVRREQVESCLDPAEPLDRLFRRAWIETIDALPRGQRSGALAGVTGHIAESVVELLLVERGYVPLAHHPGPGRHGVDLLCLHLATDVVVAVEVKGTLRAGRIPRVTRGELEQMSAAWIDKSDNPGMSAASLSSADVYGALAAVNFADLTLRVALSSDFATFTSVEVDEQLSDPSWLITSLES